MNLPTIYYEFVKKCTSALPSGFVGSDLAHQNPELHNWALELLQADGVPDLLGSEDFVFMMHQGYLFWLFKANGDPDPIVYGYKEGERQLKQLGRFSVFIANYINDSS